MFKSGIILITLFCATLYTARCEDKITVYMSPAQVGEFRKSAEICGKEYGVDPKAIRKVMDGTLPDDDAHNNFLFCTLLKGEYMDKDGHIIVDGAAKLTPLNASEEKANQVYRDCNKVTLGNPLDTAHKMADCYHEHIIITFQKPNA